MEYSQAVVVKEVELPEVRVREDSAALLRSHRVLYVDDELPNQLVFDATFGDDFNVVCVSSAAEALAVLDDEDISIVVTDNRMPGMTGIDLCAEIVRSHPHVLRVLCTAYSDQSTAIEAINRGGVQHYIVKPWDSDTVSDLLEDLVRQAHFDAAARALKQTMLADERRACVAAMRERIVHDMSNVVTVVHTACQGLEGLMPDMRTALDSSATQEIEECLGELRGARESLHRVYRETRAATDGGHLESCELRAQDVIETVARMSWTELAGIATLDSDCPPNLGLFADRVSVVRILFNLVAFAASELQRAQVRPGSVRLVASACGDMIAIDVGHNGESNRDIMRRRLNTSTFGARGEESSDALVIALARDLTEANGGRLEIGDLPMPWRTSLRVLLPTV